MTKLVGHNTSYPCYNHAKIFLNVITKISDTRLAEFFQKHFFCFIYKQFQSSFSACNNIHEELVKCNRKTDEDMHRIKS